MGGNGASSVERPGRSDPPFGRGTAIRARRAPTASRSQCGRAEAPAQLCAPRRWRRRWAWKAWSRRTRRATAEQRGESSHGSLVVEALEQVAGAGAQQVNLEVAYRAQRGAVVQDDHSGAHVDTLAAGAQEPLQVAGHVADLAPPAAPAAIGEGALLDAVAVAVELLVGPPIAVDVDADRTGLDLDGPHATMTDEQVVDLAAAVGVAAKQQPAVRQDAQRVSHRLLALDPGGLLGAAGIQPGVDGRRSLGELAQLGAVAPPRSQLPPAPRRALLAAALGDHLAMLLRAAHLLVVGGVEATQLLAGVVGEDLDDHPPGAPRQDPRGDAIAARMVRGEYAP
jgi:hypothetical protein